MTIYESLPPYEKWMVRSNLETIRNGDATVADLAAHLRMNGYARIAAAVEEIANDSNRKDQ
jgi:hypothetical protein